MAATDASAVQRIWSERFGGDPSTQEKWIEAALNSAHSAVGFVAVSTDAETVLGLSFLDVGDRSYTRHYLGLDALEATVPLEERNGIFHLSCVRADWENRGIGSAFHERRLSILVDREVPCAVGIAWHRPHPVDSRVLFEKYDFRCHATVDQYYEHLGRRQHCPNCGGQCDCSASLYGRSISTASPLQIDQS